MTPQERLAGLGRCLEFVVVFAVSMCLGALLFFATGPWSFVPGWFALLGVTGVMWWQVGRRGRARSRRTRNIADAVFAGAVVAFL
jgi:Flp pilus assembly protein TadB